jgi:hypothetical protein
MLYYQFHVICHTARDNFGYQCYVVVGGWGTVAKNYFIIRYNIGRQKLSSKGKSTQLTSMSSFDGYLLLFANP